MLLGLPPRRLQLIVSRQSDGDVIGSVTGAALVGILWQNAILSLWHKGLLQGVEIASLR